MKNKSLLTILMVFLMLVTIFSVTSTNAITIEKQTVESLDDGEVTIKIYGYVYERSMSLPKKYLQGVKVRLVKNHIFDIFDEVLDETKTNINGYYSIFAVVDDFTSFPAPALEFSKEGYKKHIILLGSYFYNNPNAKLDVELWPGESYSKSIINFPLLTRFQEFPAFRNLLSQI